MKNSLKSFKDRLKNLGNFPPPLEGDVINKIENKLEVSLPNDFKEISKLFRYDYMSNLDFFSLEREDEYSVIGTTLRWRKTVSLPKRFVALAEDSTSAIIMETKYSSEIPTPIIWCRIEDISNLVKEVDLLYSPTVFSSFTDFFDYLVTEEEKMNPPPES